MTPSVHRCLPINSGATPLPITAPSPRLAVCLIICHQLLMQHTCPDTHARPFIYRHTHTDTHVWAHTYTGMCASVLRSSYFWGSTRHPWPVIDHFSLSHFPVWASYHDSMESSEEGGWKGWWLNLFSRGKTWGINAILWDFRGQGFISRSSVEESRLLRVMCSIKDLTCC